MYELDSGFVIDLIAIITIVVIITIIIIIIIIIIMTISIMSVIIMYGVPCRLPRPHVKCREVLRKTACKDVTIKACHSPAAPSAWHMQQHSSLLPCNTMHSRCKQFPHLGMLVPARGSELPQQTGQLPGLELGQTICHLQGLRN